MSWKITIVTPSYNQGKFIKATMDSVLNQSYRNIEYLVIDGGSTDATVDILQGYRDTRLQWISEKDRGQSHAINKGLERATGDILAYINSDDTYEDGAFEFVTNYFEQNPHVMMLHGDCHVIDVQGNVTSILDGNQYTVRKAFINRWHVPQPARAIAPYQLVPL